MLKGIIKSPGKIIYWDVLEPILGEGRSSDQSKINKALCAADIAPYTGRELNILSLPMVQGHEFGGIVEEIKGKLKISRQWVK